MAKASAANVNRTERLSPHLHTGDTAPEEAGDGLDSARETVSLRGHGWIGVRHRAEVLSAVDHDFRMRGSDRQIRRPTPKGWTEMLDPGPA